MVYKVVGEKYWGILIKKYWRILKIIISKPTATKWVNKTTKPQKLNQNCSPLSHPLLSHPSRIKILCASVSRDLEQRGKRIPRLFSKNTLKIFLHFQTRLPILSIRRVLCKKTKNNQFKMSIRILINYKKEAKLIKIRWGGIRFTEQ